MTGIGTSVDGAQRAAAIACTHTPHVPRRRRNRLPRSGVSHTRLSVTSAARLVRPLPAFGRAQPRVRPATCLRDRKAVRHMRSRSQAQQVVNRGAAAADTSALRLLCAHPLGATLVEGAVAGCSPRPARSASRFLSASATSHGPRSGVRRTRLAVVPAAPLVAAAGARAYAASTPVRATSSRSAWVASAAVGNRGAAAPDTLALRLLWAHAITAYPWRRCGHGRQPATSSQRLRRGPPLRAARRNISITVRRKV